MALKFSLKLRKPGSKELLNFRLLYQTLTLQLAFGFQLSISLPPLFPKFLVACCKRGHIQPELDHNHDQIQIQIRKYPQPSIKILGKSLLEINTTFKGIPGKAINCLLSCFSTRCKLGQCVSHRLSHFCNLHTIGNLCFQPEPYQSSLDYLQDNYCKGSGGILSGSNVTSIHTFNVTEVRDYVYPDVTMLDQ